MCVSSAGRVMRMPEQGEADEWVHRSVALLSALGFPIMPLHGKLYEHGVLPDIWSGCQQQLIDVLKYTASLCCSGLNPYKMLY